MQRDAFVVSAAMISRIRKINQAIHEQGILFILAPSGSGKDRFLDWWWQEGCAHVSLDATQRISPEDIIFGSLVPPPSRSVPPTCVAFSKIWHGLRERERERRNNYHQPATKIRSWYTEQQALSLVYDHVHPLANQIDPKAIVLLNGEYLDKRALLYLLELRNPFQRGRPHLPRRALVISVTANPESLEENKFGKMVNEIKELRRFWSDHMVIDFMDAPEFQEVLLIFIRRNLQAVFANDIDHDMVIQEAAEWTQGDWRLLAKQLIPLIDQELGPQIGTTPRQFTHSTWQRVRNRWQKRLW
ncbi:hypothetical protein F8S13_11655 [Chloroflexia bacterium SDU3-3]|nr:hypothetical protein F8S13_11655 [Chloroflexia bacterium SDU3-3]